MGPKPTQDPMNIVFEQKILGEKNFRDPRPKKISDPARAGPAGPPRSPKVVQIVPLGSLTLLKRSGVLKNMQFEYKYCAELFLSANVMPKTRFWPLLGFFGPFWGPAGTNPQPSGRRTPQNRKFKNLSCFESFHPNFFSGFSSILRGLA